MLVLNFSVRMPVQVLRNNTRISLFLCFQAWLYATVQGIFCSCTADKLARCQREKKSHSWTITSTGILREFSSMMLLHV